VAATRSSNAWGYRPHLDGLRAVAVYLVVAFHAGVARASGGFIGVDVFFVLSGYLVTGVLVRDLEGPDGRIGLARFYARRARRLLPAAAVTLVVTAIVFGSIGGRVEVLDARNAIRAASLYVANWHFIAKSADYFAADLESSPVLHFWSLAVEEQFYLLWPLLFGGLYALARRAGRHRSRVLRGVIALLALASAGAALRLAEGDLDRAYYGTDTRAYQLLAGALLALSPGLIIRARRIRGGRSGDGPLWPLLSVGLLAALALLGTSRLDVEPIRRGVLVTGVTVALILALEVARGGIGRRLLSLPPVVYLGKISYGTYLWHWLVIVVLAHETDVGPWATLAVAIPVATGLASLSYQLLELPVRTAPALDRLRAVTISAGLAISLLVGLVVAPAFLEEGDLSSGPVDEAAPAVVGGVDQAKVGAAFFDNFDYEACPSSSGTACVLAQGSGQTAMVVGDSHAATWAPMLADLAARHDLTLLGGFMSYCPWPRGIRYAAAGAECLADQDVMYDQVIPRFDPDIVFLAHRPVDDPNDELDVVDLEAGGPLRGAERAAALERRVRETVAALVADGRTVVVFEPVPVAPTDLDPRGCLEKRNAVEPCRFVASGSTREDQVIREVAEGGAGRVVAIDADELTCPWLPICDPMVGGEVARRDNNHLGITFSRTLLGPIEEYLVAQGVLG
jgi:peptidoglycan/LPS O-acetylase OafA/YrhL